MDTVECPGCGFKLESEIQGVDERFNASRACLDCYHQLIAFTLSLGDRYFIHQVAVDAYAAQHAGPGMKSITASFALIGLYLIFEHGYSGKEVQQAHMLLAG